MDLEEYSVESYKMMIQYIYEDTTLEKCREQVTGTFMVVELLKLSHLYELSTLFEMMELILIPQVLTIESCVEWWSFAKMYCAQKLKLATEFLVSQNHLVVSQSTPFKKLSTDEKREIVSASKTEK